eukprot:g16735.t1
MTAKEGRAFRPEVLHLAALTAIDYNVESFRLYNKRRRKNVLTESTVLAVPVHVMEGTVSADESGVTVEQLQGVCSWGHLWNSQPSSCGTFGEQLRSTEEDVAAAPLQDSVRQSLEGCEI